MQQVQIQIPDKDDLKDLLREFKHDMLKELKMANRPTAQAPEIDYKTRDEIRRKYSISLQTLSKHVRSGCPVFRVGRRVLFDPQKVQAYFDAKNKK
jgi:hypothetical protein